MRSSSSCHSPLLSVAKAFTKAWQYVDEIAEDAWAQQQIRESCMSPRSVAAELKIDNPGVSPVGSQVPTGTKDMVALLPMFSSLLPPRCPLIKSLAARRVSDELSSASSRRSVVGGQRKQPLEDRTRVQSVLTLSQVAGATLHKPWDRTKMRTAMEVLTAGSRLGCPTRAQKPQTPTAL